MMKNNSYISPKAEVFPVRTEQSFLLSYNETNKTENLGRDLIEEDL